MVRLPQFVKLTYQETLAILLGTGISESVKTLTGSPSWIVFAFVLAPISTLLIFGGVTGFVRLQKSTSKKLADSIHWIVLVQSGLGGGIVFGGILAGTTSILWVPALGVGLFFGVLLVNWNSNEDSAPTTKPPSSDEWFNEEDLNLLSKPRLFLLAAYGVLVGLVSTALITIYLAVFYRPLLDWFLYAVGVGTVLVAGLGLFRNRVLKRVATKGLPAVFRFQRVAFTFYVEAVLTGALGLGYGYGYVSAQSTILVLPLAGLFMLFLYLYFLWKETLVKSEEGRLCIFQFIVEHDKNGHGYSWLKRGLSITRDMLESFGVSAKRNGLYFGSSYSLLEGSYLEWDLDNIYFLGDWTSQPNELRPVHEIASWFLHLSKKAEKRGFSRVFSFLDRLYELSPQSVYYIIAAAGAIVGIVTAVLRR